MLARAARQATNVNRVHKIMAVNKSRCPPWHPMPMGTSFSLSMKEQFNTRGLRTQMAAFCLIVAQQITPTCALCSQHSHGWHHAATLIAHNCILKLEHIKAKPQKHSFTNSTSQHKEHKRDKAHKGHMGIKGGGCFPFIPRAPFGHDRAPRPRTLQIQSNRYEASQVSDSAWGRCATTHSPCSL